MEERQIEMDVQTEAMARVTHCQIKMHKKAAIAEEGAPYLEERQIEVVS